MKKLILIFVLACFATTLLVNAEETDIIKNKIFSIAIPKDLKNTYSAKVKKDCISLYNKESKKAGFGGFAFGIRAYKNPADHAEMPGGRKLGELMSSNGDTYDIVLKQPTDVQYDYTKSTTPPDTYKRLYDLGKNVDIKGIKGNFYFKNKGMKGIYLYGEILRKHKTAMTEKWDSSKLEKEKMSYMYNIIPKDKIGYTYYDINGDGIEELLIGEIATGAWKGVIYDIYTMVDRKPQHVISGGSRDRYYACDDAFVTLQLTRYWTEHLSEKEQKQILVFLLQALPDQVVVLLKSLLD